MPSSASSSSSGRAGACRLTPAGEAALPAIGQLWTEAERVFGHLASLAGHPVTTVRVAVSDYLGKALLVPVLRELLDARLPARFEIVTTHSRDAIGRVVRGEIEFGVVTASTVPAGLDVRELFEQAFVWAGPRRGRGSLVERLAREPLLRLGAESQGRRLLDDFLERERLAPVSTIDVTSVSLMLAYITGGIGIGLVPALALRDVARARVAIEPADVPATPVRLVSRPAARRSAVAQRFAAAVEAEGRRAATSLATTRRPARVSGRRASSRAPGRSPT